MNKTEYEKNPHAYWGAEQPNRGSSEPMKDLPTLEHSPLWVKNILPEIKANSDYELCLDLGCGGGRYIGHTAQYFVNVIGIDFSAYNIKRATRDFSRLGNIEFVLSSLGNIKFIKDNSVDFAYSAAVFMHMPNMIKRLALGELARVLKPEGRAVLVEIVPVINGAFDCPDIGIYDWQNIIEEAGLKIISNEDANPFGKYKLKK